MSRSTRWLPICVSAFLLGSLVTGVLSQLPSASAATGPVSRPIVWVSGQDAGLVFVVNTATRAVKTFDFLHGGRFPSSGTANPATPQILGVGGTPAANVSPKPHLITFSPDARIAYVSFQNTNPGAFAAIDTQTFAVHVVQVPNAGGTPANQPTKLTEVKPSPDGTVLLVGEIGNNGAPAGGVGVLTKMITNEPTNPTNPTFTVAGQLTTLPGGGLLSNTGPACSSFSPDGTKAYTDSSLESVRGVYDIDPVTLSVLAFHTTNGGDPQCGIHDPIIMNSVPTIVVTDNGPGTTGPGHVHLIDTTKPDNFTEVPPSPVAAKNLHDNWPVQLEPVNAPTTDPLNTVYASDRDAGTLHRMLLQTPTDQVLTMTDPYVPATPPGLTAGTAPGQYNPRSAPDTTDGSGNTVFVAMKEFGDLGIVDNFSTQSYIHLVNPVASCGIVGNANFDKCFTVHALAVQPNKNSNQIIVAANTTVVLTGAHITGSIQVQAGGNLILSNSTVVGSIVSNGAASVRICGSTIGGSVTVSGSKGFVLIGDPGDDACPGNIIRGAVNLRNNTGGLELVGNTISGSLTTSGNSGSGPFLPDDAAPEINS